MDRLLGPYNHALLRASDRPGRVLCLRWAMVSLAALLAVGLSGCSTIWAMADVEAPPPSRLDPELTFSTFEARLSSGQTADRDMQELVLRLMEEWLARFTRPDVHRRFKLADFEVHQVVITAADPAGDAWQLRSTFSVQPVKASLSQSAWLAGNGVYESGWIYRKTLFMQVRRHPAGDLVLRCGGTGP